jgi:hypothetical protein
LHAAVKLLIAAMWYKSATPPMPNRVTGAGYKEKQIALIIVSIKKY